MRESNRIFKDWVMPGPRATGDTSLTPEAGETLDALSGLWKIFQYEKGHRYSTDDLLTAWYGTTNCPSASRVLDLGSGIGSVGMLSAWRLPHAQFVTIEAQEISVRLARKSATYNGITERYKILQGDLRDSSLLESEELFDLVLGSPPYFPLGTGVEGHHPQTIPCRFEVRGDLSDYMRAAAPRLGPGGIFAFVFPTLDLDRVEKAAVGAGLTLFKRRDVVFRAGREGNKPLVSLFAAAVSSDLPVSLREKTFVEPPLVVRTQTGEVHPEYRTVKLTMGFRP